MTLTTSSLTPSNPEFEMEAEPELWAKLRHTGSTEARAALFDRHAGYARAIAVRLYVGRLRDDVEFADFYQLACVGLIESIDRFDPARGVQFRTYATRRIEGSILDGVVRLSDAQEQIALRTRLRASRTVSLVEGSPAMIDSQARLLVLTDVAIGLAIGFMLEETGMYVDEGHPSESQDGYETVAWKEVTQTMSAALDRLPQRERRVLKYHYYQALTFEQIADLMQLTKGRISQIHKDALARLRGAMQRSESLTLWT